MEHEWPLNHLGSIWYHSEPSDVRYSENLIRPISWFGLFLQQNDSNYTGFTIMMSNLFGREKKFRFSKEFAASSKYNPYMFLNLRHLWGATFTQSRLELGIFCYWKVPVLKYMACAFSSMYVGLQRAQVRGWPRIYY